MPFEVLLVFRIFALLSKILKMHEAVLEQEIFISSSGAVNPYLLNS
ncbi:MAG: hypothetical protein JW776_09260 [Candidatus Lokiarchaeota archaeon]|nr:hypothetical protein [Candidatus Lokiarchaeota archaeon]